MSSQSDNNGAQNEGVNDLPDEAREMYRALTCDGTDWRASATLDIARVSQRLRERAMRLGALSGAETGDNSSTPSSQAADDPRDGVLRATVRTSNVAPPVAWWRGWVMTGVTAALVSAFLATLMVTARPSSSAHDTTKPTATATTPATWVDLSKLDYSTTFSANDLPAIAPSDPNVVYETMAQGMQQHQPASMRMTMDGGATWRSLPLPIKADHIGFMGVGVSPIDPRTVYLTVIDTDAAECPANRLTPGSGNAYSGSFCWLQYVSVDGGGTWRPIDLPVVNGATAGMLAASISSGINHSVSSGPIRAQGQRLYAGYQCTGPVGISCARLVTSSDAGRSWRFADAGLLMGGRADICDFGVSLRDAIIYAVTSTAQCKIIKQSPLMLWKSYNGGVTWTKVGSIATSTEWGMVPTQNAQTGARLLYMALPAIVGQATDKMGGHYPIIAQAPSDVKVSLDGGATWQAAPNRGIPTGHVVYFNVGLLGALGDGSVVVDVIRATGDNALAADNFSGSALYAWKPGETGWRFIASVPREIDSLLITPSKAGAGDTLYATLVNRGSQNTFAITKLDLAY